MMDSPPECVLSLSCERSESPPTLPSLDHSPQTSSPPALLSLPDSPVVLPINSPEPSSQSTVDTPYFSLSPFTLHEENDSIHQDQDQDQVQEQDPDQEVEGLDGVPPSPTPAVALFPGGVGQDAGCSSGCLDSSPPATPSAPGFGALELALSSGQSGSCNDELDLQLFQKDTASRVAPREGGGGGGGGGGASSSPALRFPCHVCGKRFRFQSILSLHARAHSLDRDRRASALYRAGLPSPSTKQHATTQSNHKDLTQSSRNHSNQNFLPQTLIKHLTENVDVKEDERKPHFLLSDSTPPTPPLTEDPVVCAPSPLYSSSSSSSSAAVASTFRCHACKGKFRTASELARHVRILHNPYKCTFCPFSANQEESLASHLQEVHPSPEVPALPLAFNSRSLLTTPDTPVPTPSNTPAPQLTPAPISSISSTSSTSSSSSSSLPAFRCDTCGQRFTQSWFLKGHMRKHKDSLDHKCQVCGRGFKEPWFLKNHMKVHLNKLGLKAGLEGAAVQQHAAKGPASSQSLSALYSNLLLAQRGASRARLDREAGRTSVGSSKAALLGYLGLPSDGSGASCMERLQAVAQVAEMGSGGGGGGGGVSSSGGTRTSRARGTTESSAPVPDAGDHATWWQLVARSLAAAQQQQQQHQQGQRGGSGRTSVTADADRVRAYLGGLDRREDSGGASGPWECPDCGKLFRSLQQVVVHARVHTQRPQKGAGGEEESGGGRRGVGQERGGSAELRQEALVSSAAQHPDARHKPKVSGGESHPAGAAHGFHSVISSFKGVNGTAAASSSSVPPLGSRERVRGRGIKDCPYCGKAFRSSHHLKVHLRVHTGERPYKCPHCDYAGTQSGSLKYHLQRHHREQRNALAASANSPTTGLTSTINSLNCGSSGSSGSSGPGKQRRSQLNHFPTNQGQAGISNSRSNQQSWPMALQDPQEHQKALEALRDVDLETQYRYLSGVMALYQGGMDGGWIRETPPQKAAKVSRRKPLTTSRMVPSSSDKERRSSSAQQGGFEPLDLSHRPSPGLGGMEEGGGISFGEGGGVGGENSGGGGSSAGIKLSQCLFCPFGTSSAELMAMHLQVNHTSKSRRKRGSLVTADDDVAPKVTKVKVDLTSDRNSAAVWKYVSDVEVEEPQRERSSVKTKVLNGLGEDAARHLEAAFDHPDLTMASMSNNLGDSLEREEKMEEEDEQDEEPEEVLGSSALEN